jgi:hypothetical protein
MDKVQKPSDSEFHTTLDRTGYVSKKHLFPVNAEIRTFTAAVVVLGL